jgi:hypothetical protein
MAPPQTLTRQQGDALSEAHEAARLSADSLVTHFALYQWNAAQGVWQLESAERIIKASGAAGTFV